MLVLSLLSSKAYDIAFSQVLAASIAACMFASVIASVSDISYLGLLFTYQISACFIFCF